MPSNFALLSLVARSALTFGNRKLRAKPSLTRTTSPIWPSLATRSSRITSMFSLRGLVRVVSVSSRVVGWRSERRPRWWFGAAPGDTGADVERALGEAEHRHGQDRQARERNDH